MKTDRDSDDLPVSVLIARRGIRTSQDFAEFMGAMMGDLVEGTIDPDVASAACAAGDKMLKVVEMQIKYGKEHDDGTRTLQLSGSPKKLPINSKTKRV